MDIAIALIFIAGMIALFKLLYQTIAEEKIDWWDSATFVVLGSIIRRVFSFAHARVEFIPDWINTWGVFAFYNVLFYFLLRAWKKVERKQAGIIIAIWIPTTFVVSMAVYFIVLKE